MIHRTTVRRFLIVGHRGSPIPAFPLDDLAGGAGRMDILLNGANAALHLAHDLRRDVEVGLLLLGPPRPPRFVRLEGFRLRNYQPDIRSKAALVRRALEGASRIERESSPGVFASQASFEEALDCLGPVFVYAEEGRTDIRQPSLPADATLVVAAHQALATPAARGLSDR